MRASLHKLKTLLVRLRWRLFSLRSPSLFLISLLARGRGVRYWVCGCHKLGNRSFFWNPWRKPLCDHGLKLAKQLSYRRNHLQPQKQLRLCNEQLINSLRLSYFVLASLGSSVMCGTSTKSINRQRCNEVWNVWLDRDVQHFLWPIIFRSAASLFAFSVSSEMWLERRECNLLTSVCQRSDIITTGRRADGETIQLTALYRVSGWWADYKPTESSFLIMSGASPEKEKRLNHKTFYRWTKPAHPGVSHEMVQFISWFLNMKTLNAWIDQVGSIIWTLIISLFIEHL